VSGVASIRAEIRNEIGLINPLDEIELAAKTDVLAWIDSGVELCRLQKPAVPPKHLVSYFAVLAGVLRSLRLYWLNTVFLFSLAAHSCSLAQRGSYMYGSRIDLPRIGD